MFKRFLYCKVELPSVPKQFSHAVIVLCFRPQKHLKLKMIMILVTCEKNVENFSGLNLFLGSKIIDLKSLNN